MSRLSWLSRALVLSCVLTCASAFAKDEPSCDPNLASAIPAQVANNLSPLAKKAAIAAFNEDPMSKSVLRYAKGAAVRAGETRAIGDYVFTITVNFTYSKEGGDLHSQDFLVRVLGSGKAEVLESLAVEHSQITPRLPVENIEEAAMQYVFNNKLGDLLDINVLPLNASLDLPKDFRVRIKVKKANGFDKEIIKIGRLHPGGAISIMDL